MALDPTADLDALLADLGVPVTKGGATVRGLLDETDVVETDPSGEQIVVRGTSVVLKTGALPLAVGDALTVDGGSYVVRDPRLLDDGNLTRILVARA